MKWKSKEKNVRNRKSGNKVSILKVTERLCWLQKIAGKNLLLSLKGIVTGFWTLQGKNAPGCCTCHWYLLKEKQFDKKMSKFALLDLLWSLGSPITAAYCEVLRNWSKGLNSVPRQRLSTVMVAVAPLVHMPKYPSTRYWTPELLG